MSHHIVHKGVGRTGAATLALLLAAGACGANQVRASTVRLPEITVLSMRPFSDPHSAFPPVAATVTSMRPFSDLMYGIRPAPQVPTMRPFSDLRYGLGAGVTVESMRPFSDLRFEP